MQFQSRPPLSPLTLAPSYIQDFITFCSGLTLIEQGIVGLLTALIYVQVTDKIGSAPTKIRMFNQKLIPRGKIIHAAVIWETWVQTCYNYERMMGIACAITFLPVIKYLYPGNMEKQIEVMTCRAEFFNVHPEFGSGILGMAISLEEDKAQGADIPNEFITNLKTSLMGPPAGVGDTIYSSNDLFEFIMGCMVMGGLIVNYVSVHCGIVINASGTEFKLQESLFDAVLPNILPLTATLAIYGARVYRHRARFIRATTCSSSRPHFCRNYAGKKIFVMGTNSLLAEFKRFNMPLVEEGLSASTLSSTTKKID